MLKTILSWTLYGERSIWIRGMILITLFIVLMSLLLILPNMREHVVLSQKTIQMKRDLDNEQKTLRKSLPMIIKPDLMSWPDLAKKYRVSIRMNVKQVYFAGNTDNILSLLNFVLLNAYDMKHFKLEKSDHKTLLTIQL